MIPSACLRTGGALLLSALSLLPTASAQRLEIQAHATGGDWGYSSFSAPLLVVAPVWERDWFLALGFGVLGAGLAVLVSMLMPRRRNTALAEEVRSTHEALAGTARRYSELFECSPSILLLIEPGTGLVLEANTAAVQYFGNSLESLRQQSLSELTGLSQERLEEGFASLAAGEEWIVRPGEDDPVFGPPVEIRTRQLSLGGEETVQATIFDIEAQQNQEQERIEAQKLRAVAELASGVAHDFNNLLTAILGHNELIELDAGSDERVAAHVASIRAAGEKGANLVRQLLAFGRKHRLEVEELDLGRVIREISPLMQTVIGSDLRLTLELGDQEHQVLADRAELEEVLMNLVLCARDALTTSGQLRLTLSQRVAPLDLAGEDPYMVGTELVQLSVTATVRTPEAAAAPAPPPPPRGPRAGPGRRTRPGGTLAGGRQDLARPWQWHRYRRLPACPRAPAALQGPDRRHRGQREFSHGQHPAAGGRRTRGTHHHQRPLAQRRLPRAGGRQCL